jgi:hypothetical protein
MSLSNVESFKVASTLAANRIVYVSAADTVAYGLTITNCPIGITQDTVLDTTMSIPVKTHGISKLEFNDSVTAGGLVGSNASGMGIPFVAVTAASWAVGILLSTKVNTTGTVADVLVMPIGAKNLT